MWDLWMLVLIQFEYFLENVYSTNFFNFSFFFTDMVSYSNYKRHLKNAHPSINHEDFVTEEEGEQQPKYLGHQVDDDDLDQNNLVVDGDERGDQVKYKTIS